MLETQGGPQHFSTTKWTMVSNAQDQNEKSLAGSALEALCQAYWYPLYAFARRKGWDPHDAQDHTQGFLARMLENNYLQNVDRSKGKFRSFLMASFTNYLSDQRKRTNAKKRGGDADIASLDAVSAEGRYDLEPIDERSSDPAALFDRAWANTLLERVLGHLEQDCIESGKGPLFANLRQFLVGGADEQLKEVSERLGMTDSGLRVNLHRMRKRYAELFRQEVAQTVARPEDIELEMQALLEALT